MFMQSCNQRLAKVFISKWVFGAALLANQASDLDDNLPNFAALNNELVNNQD